MARARRARREGTGSAARALRPVGRRQTPSPSWSQSAVRELEERSAEIRAVVQELEHREERARELHNKVEQILRDGAAELDLRQAELSVRSAELEQPARRRSSSRDEASTIAVARSAPWSCAPPRSNAARRPSDSASAELEHRAGELAELARQLDELGKAVAERRAATRARGRARRARCGRTATDLVVRARPGPEAG